MLGAKTDPEILLSEQSPLLQALDSTAKAFPNGDFINLQAHFRASCEQVYFHNDPHLTGRGQGIVAQNVATWIKENLPLE